MSITLTQRLFLAAGIITTALMLGNYLFEASLADVLTLQSEIIHSSCLRLTTPPTPQSNPALSQTDHQNSTGQPEPNQICLGAQDYLPPALLATGVLLLLSGVTGITAFLSISGN